MFLINCQWNLEELEHHLDAASKRYIAENNIQLYLINAIDLAIKVGMGKRTNTILQSAFFSLAKVMPEAEAIGYMKAAAEASYLKKGRDVVDKNWDAIDAGATAYVKVDVPASWATAEDNKAEEVLEGTPETVAVVKNILNPVGKMNGYSLPVSAFTGMKTASSPWALLLTRSAALPSPFPSGTRPSASSATTVPMSAPTPPSVPTL